MTQQEAKYITNSAFHRKRKLFFFCEWHCSPRCSNSIVISSHHLALRILIILTWAVLYIWRAKNLSSFVFILVVRFFVTYFKGVQEYRTNILLGCLLLFDTPTTRSNAVVPYRNISRILVIFLTFSIETHLLRIVIQSDIKTVSNNLSPGLSIIWWTR